MNITPDTRVADLAAENPATLRVFERFGIDFCCGGKRPLAQVCAEKQVTFGELRTALEAAGEPAGTEMPKADAELTEIIRFVVVKYHADLRSELPRLSAMVAKVLAAHGTRFPEVLPELAEVFQGLREELELHMAKEERVLFPYVERLEDVSRAGRTAPAPPFGSIAAPISMMEHEHESAGRALARLRELTAGYTLPEGACNTFRGLYHGLAELEKALHEHIHLENNVLFPRAARLEQELRRESMV